MQDIYAAAWRAVDSNAQICLRSSIEDALNFAKLVGDRENGMRTLVTGDMYLVGTALDLLESQRLK